LPLGQIRLRPEAAAGAIHGLGIGRAELGTRNIRVSRLRNWAAGRGRPAQINRLCF